MRVGLDGSCADVTPEGDRAEGLYGDVIPLGEDSCIAVRSVRTESGYTEYLGRLDAGGLAWQLELPGSWSCPAAASCTCAAAETASS